MPARVCSVSPALAETGMALSQSSNRSCCRNDNARWYDFALDARGRGGDRPDLADQLVLDAISLLDVDMDYLAVVRKIDTGIVAVEVAALPHLALTPVTNNPTPN